MLNKDLVDAFYRLANQLSPENLTCDGELSRTRVKQRLASLRSQWRELEKKAGRKVSEGEVYEMIREHHA